MRTSQFITEPSSRHLGSQGENSVIHCRDEAERKAMLVALLRGTASVAFFCTLIVDISFDNLLRHLTQHTNVVAGRPQVTTPQFALRFWVSREP